ncbi:unnamed protein product [Pedinophyceae sp. YPF-701]|nr:unnamed protein product [Pedinophyceae sp. YPF-701]
MAMRRAAKAAEQAVPQVLRCVTSSGARAAGGAVPMVDEMIAMVRSAEMRGQPAAGMDILRSGLSMPQVKQSVIDAGRITVAMAEVASDSGDDGAAATLAEDALAQLAKGGGWSFELALQATHVGTLSLLRQGKDEAAQQLAQAACERAPTPKSGSDLDAVRRTGLSAAKRFLAHTRLCCGDFDGAGKAADEAEEMDRGLGSISGADADTRLLCPAALLRAGTVLGVLERGDDAKRMLQCAGDLATVGARGADSPGGVNDARAAVLNHPVALQLVSADAHAQLAQAQLRARAWSDAEKSLESALSAAEALPKGTVHDVAVGTVLMLTASAYVNTARFAMAEGLFVEAGKMIGVPLLDFMSLDANTATARAKCHGTTVAHLLWRFGEMVNMVENRRHQGKKLQGVAADVWKKHAATHNDPGAVLGNLKDGTGAAHVINLSIGRVLFRPRRSE